MTSRQNILEAARVAASYLEDGNARARIKDGYTRIDPIGIAENRGLYVGLKKLDKLLGAYLRNPEPGILINSDRPVGLFHMTGAHELGHFALGHDSTVDETMEHEGTTDPKEAEADTFARALLAPRWLVVHTLRSRHVDTARLTQGQTIYQLSLRMGLSYTALITTLASMGFLPRGNAEQLRKKQPQQSKAAAVINNQKLEGTQDIWVLTPADRDCVLEPRATDLFVLEVPNRVASGFLWTIDEARREGFTLVPQEHEDRRPVPEGDGLSHYELHGVSAKALAQGEAVTFVEERPWSKERNESFTLRTEVELMAEGMSPGTKRRRIEALRHVR